MEMEETGKTSGKSDQRESNHSAIRRSLKRIRYVLRRIYQKVFFLDQWILLFHRSENVPTSFSDFKKLVPPKDRFWADPHAIQIDNKYYIFIEEYIYSKQKGHISVIAVDGEGNCEAPIPVLEKEYHLSYPCVFEWEGRYYLIPENAENRTIDLYECIEFPNKWVFRMNLMENVHAVDSTLFRHDGKWWLFTGIAENEESLPLVKLFLFYSDVLLTQKWTPHPLNPIISDAKKGRPAGPIFMRNGRMNRPSQDCSGFYGYGCDLKEIVVLSETEYLEEHVASVRPEWDKDIKGIHTFTRKNDLTVIDGFVRRRKYFLR
jgi:hypothetical protein